MTYVHETQVTAVMQQITNPSVISRVTAFGNEAALLERDLKMDHVLTFQNLMMIVIDGRFRGTCTMLYEFRFTQRSQLNVGAHL